MKSGALWREEMDALHASRDVVEVDISSIGVLRNSVVWERGQEA
jgi:hypothetical protein